MSLVPGPGFDPRVPVNRADGRPEAYDMPGLAVAGVRCAACAGTDKRDQVYGVGEIFMCSPIDAADGQAHMVCKDHLPDNVVIYDPKTNTCRDKSGDNVWTE